jgi:hypothetical protein
MNWFYRWLKNRLDDSNYNELASPSVSNRKISRLIHTSDVDTENGLNITVRTAVGGKIITFRHYDSRTDRSTHKLYIIPEELVVERELGNMITLVSMRG